ncbi:MAG: ArnT family glycosyltransferase [Sphingobacteriales bacterium]
MGNKHLPVLQMKDNYKPIYLLLFILALVVNFSGINLDFFTDDPGLYAAISKNMLHRKEWLELFTYNQDWLDKPHFPFWAVLVSFKLFGVSVWAYRLPALLFFLLSLLYTWLFTKKHYGNDIAWIAVLILATAQHLVMSNTDVRAEPYLMALVIGSIYHISRLEERFTFTDLLLAALLTACAIMTKGIFVIVAIYGALFGQLVFKGKLRQAFQWKWVVLLILTGIFILPEIYALYIQFDAHPEKTVFHRHNVSGIKWFLWDSQFGRFVNKGAITRQAGSIFFYVHTLLWAFAPWCLVFYYAIYQNIKEMLLGRPFKEYYALSGGILLLVLFSLSRFQLPFYTNTIFPLFAIVTAPYCYNQLGKFGSKLRSVSLSAYAILLLIAIAAIYYVSDAGHSVYLAVDFGVFIILAYYIKYRVKVQHIRLFLFACIASLFVNFYLNTVLYKLIIDYRGQIKAAVYVDQKDFDKYDIYSLRTENNIFQFYSDRQIAYIPLDSFKNFKPVKPSVFYVNKPSVDSLHIMHANFKVIKAFQNYPQENILPAFINKNTRNTTLDSVYLITK